ncbi:CPBP family glutamic-type intramembrane protease [Ancylomarina longa]|uniref:CPBP family intramembrane metalloprotease n=1 Tax=Ancylomarina longa TaxID=2487017 RepID=A0A434AEL8_9BACT|nr:CPBP family intramembrane metalloprotease [Ancylomarina longa]
MELFSFIRRGEFAKSKPTVKSLLFLLFTYLIFSIPISFPLVILNVFHLIPKYITLNHEASLKYILAVIIFAPIIEELTFRLLLIPKYSYISFSLSLIIITFSKSIWGTNYGYELYLLALPAFCLAHYIFKDKSFNTTKSVKLLVHISVVIFAFMHIFNFVDVKTWMYFIFPILTAPQILMGYILSFSRLKYGFLFGVLLHMLVNFTISLAMLFKFFFS